jgi:uncharacterized protein
MKTKAIWPRGALMLCVSLLWAAGTPLAGADDAARAAKLAELMRLTGVAQMLADWKLAGQAAARKTIETVPGRMFAKFPAIPPREHAQIEGAAVQFQRDVDDGFDQDDAVRTWGRLYSGNLTDADLDAILSFYRSPAGQKDVSATSAAMPQFQHYMVEKNAATMKAAVANYTAALQSIVDSSTADVTPARPWDSNPTAPDGLVAHNQSSSERCDVTPSTAGVARAVPPTGRSIVCVCIDEKGILTRNPVIAASSGDSRVDSGAVKMARSDSGRYKPPTLDGVPQRGCFRFAIDFRHQQ